MGTPHNEFSYFDRRLADPDGVVFAVVCHVAYSAGGWRFLRARSSRVPVVSVFAEDVDEPVFQEDAADMDDVQRIIGRLERRILDGTHAFSVTASRDRASGIASPPSRSRLSSASLSASLWVRLEDWVPVEAEMPDPDVGSVLRGAGLCVYGELESADAQTADGFVVCSESADGLPRPVEYLVTGTATAAREFQTDTQNDAVHTERRRRVEVVLSVDGLDIQVETAGRASGVPLGTRMRVRGQLEVIPFYKWTDFGLVDTRRDWAVDEALDLPDGDMLLQLRPVDQEG